MDGIKCGYNLCTVRGNDTDILVILTAFMPSFIEKNNMFKLFYQDDDDVGEAINVGNILKTLGVNRCRCLLSVHAFTLYRLLL